MPNQKTIVPDNVRGRWMTLTHDRGLTLGDLAEKTVAERPESWLICASLNGETRWTHASFITEARQIAGGLADLGVGSGDVVAVQLAASIEAVLVHAACSLLGAVLLPIIHIYGGHELQFVLRESEAKVVVTASYVKNQSVREIIRNLPDLPRLKHHVVVGRPDGGLGWDDLRRDRAINGVNRGTDQDVALLIYTSGTTSNPKGVQHSHASISADLSLGLGTFITPDDTILCPWPPGHIAGYLLLARFWARGYNTVLMEQWDGALAARLIDNYKVVLTQGTPFHMTAVLDAAERDGLDLSSVKEYVCGATIVSPQLVNRSMSAGVMTLRSYGLTECPTATRGTRNDPLEKRLYTDGRPAPGVEVRIIDESNNDVPRGQTGEVILRAPKQFIGYRRQELNEDVFLPGGWMRTGDIGALDAEGYLSITDRKKDIIIRGGENISSREVEELVAMMAAVQEVAAVGVPDEVFGERVCIFIRLHEGATLTIEDIDKFFRQKGVARQKTPERLIVVQELPRTLSGKVKKNELRLQATFVPVSA